MNDAGSAIRSSNGAGVGAQSPVGHNDLPSEMAVEVECSFEVEE